MDSPHSVVSPFKGSVVPEPEQRKSQYFVQTSGSLPKEIAMNENSACAPDLEDRIGVLDVHIHQARNIHNICLYRKQDVYAKLCMTSNPEKTVCTKIIYDGGRNPVFHDSLRLRVRTLDSSLKCEIWMLSRAAHYIQDQLLGFTLVPLSEVLIKNGELEKEFSLSSTDLFHSPVGFIQLSLSYTGLTPDVVAIPAPPSELNSADEHVQDSDISESLAHDLEKIEFPDVGIVNGAQMMVSEYFNVQCTNLDLHMSEGLVTSDAQNNLNLEGVVIGSPPSSVSTNRVSSLSVQASLESSGAVESSKSPNQGQVSRSKERTVDPKNDERDLSGGSPREIKTPMLTVNVESEKAVVQQEIVDMYMKSMQQFTESLEKMKLPLDIEPASASTTSTNDSGNSSSEHKLQTPRSNVSRVFYGSRAFF